MTDVQSKKQNKYVLLVVFPQCVCICIYTLYHGTISLNSSQGDQCIKIDPDHIQHKTNTVVLPTHIMSFYSYTFGRGILYSESTRYQYHILVSKIYAYDEGGHLSSTV